MERDKSNETLEPPGEPYLDSPRHLDEYDEGVFDEDIQLADWQDGHFGHPDSTYQMQTHMHGEPPGEVIDESMRYSHTISPPPPPFLPVQDAGNEPPIDSPQGSALDEAIQYAYENSLASDYLLQSFSLSHLFGPLAQGTIPLTNEDGFTDHSELRVLCVPESILTDKMQVTTSSFKLIAKARYIPSEEELQDATNQVCSPAKVEASKLELPILRTDNDRDLRTFQKDLLQRTSANALLESIKKHRLPLHPQNLAEGEGMELSSEAHAESEAMMKKAEGEKLTVTKASIEYLVSQLKDDYTIEDKTAHMIEETTCEKTRKPEKITPPASPKLVNSHSLPLQPAFDPGNLPVLSDDSSSLLSDNFHAIEDMMLGNHRDTWSANTSPIREMLEDVFDKPPKDTDLECPRQNRGNMKVEMLLLRNDAPRQIGPSGPEDYKRFITEESGLDLDPVFEKAALRDIPGDDLDEHLQQAAGYVMRAIEQEQLQAIDAVGRVPLPVMDFSVTQPEWKRLGNSAKSIFQWLKAGKEQLYKPPSWPLDRVAGSKMIWSPLTQGAGKGRVVESLSGEMHLLQEVLEVARTSDILTSLSFVCCKDQPAVFEDDDGDEEIEPQLKKAEVGLVRAAKKRLTETNAESISKRPRQTLIEPSLSRSTKRSSPSLLPGDSPGATGKLLANFMEVHAPKKKIVAHSKYFTSQQTEAHASPGRTVTPVKQITHAPLARAKPSPRAPCPAMKPPSTPLTVFISISIHRRMIRMLESLIPDLTLLERNYDAHNTFTWQPGSVVRTEVVPSLADDADVTVSPSTGIIVTSMLRVRQKPKSGTTKGMVQIRVEKASLRYERLIVLVGGEGSKSDELAMMSASDSAAFLELQGFSSGLDCSIQVYYVGGGGDKTLASWMASFVCRHSLAGPAILAGLLEPETLWEVFLRRAGFNVFAAQAVASHFKPPIGQEDVPPSDLNGLGVFMTMTRDERMRRFGQLVGPKVLQRVSSAVDELWNKG